MINESQLSFSLIEQYPLHIQLPNFLFDSIRNFILKKNQIKIIVSSFKYLLGMIVIILGFIFAQTENGLINEQTLFNLKNMEGWIYVTVVHSFLGVIQYKVIQKYLNKYQIVLKLAQQMDLVNNIIIIEEDLDQQQLKQKVLEQNEQQNQQLFDRLLLYDQRNIAMIKLSEELYENLQNNYIFLKILNKSLLIIFFMVELFALLFLLFCYDIYKVNSAYYQFCVGYMILVLLTGLYQYFSTFVLIILYILFLPVFIGIKIYYWYQNWKDRRLQKNKTLDMFEEFIFSKIRHSVENYDCAICMSTFDAKEKVIILSCSDKHIFHKDCIVDWLQLNTNCPLCRKQVIDYQ